MRADEYDFESPEARWVTVFTGSFSQVLSMRTLVEGEGILTWVPDETMKTVDPFVTGVNPLGMELRVPETEVDRVGRMLADMRRAAGPAAAPVEPTDTERVVQQGVVVRWCFVFAVLGWIAGTWLGWRYLAAARRLEKPPPSHGLTVTLWLLQVALLITVLATSVGPP